MTTLTLVTDHGPLDVSQWPDGTDGYSDLIAGAEAIDLDGVLVPLASLADIIRSKEAAGRERDLQALPILERFLREQSQR